MTQDKLSASLTVAVPAATVFGVLTDPASTSRSTAPAGSRSRSTGRR